MQSWNHLCLDQVERCPEGASERCSIEAESSTYLLAYFQYVFLFLSL